MSIRTLSIWMILAGLLGVGVLIARSQQLQHRLQAPLPTTRTLGFDPARIAVIETNAASRRQILSQDPDQPDQWIIHWTQGGLDFNWPAQPIKARSGLRALATARINTSDENLVLNPAGTLILRNTDGSSVNVEFDADSSGGVTPVTIEERGADGIATLRWFGRIEKSISDAFITAGMLHWRSDIIFDIPSSAVRSVDVKAGPNEVQLERSAKGWQLIAPYQIHGNRTAIEDLIKSVISMKTSSFVDQDADTKSTWMDNPIASIRISTASQTTTLVIGAQADVNGQSVYATIETPAHKALVTLPTDQLTGLTAAPAAYIGKSPSPQSFSSIYALEIQGRDAIPRIEATRSGELWTIGQEQADSLNRDAINRLIRVLTQSDAQHIQMHTGEGLPKPIGYVRLLDEQGNELDRFAVALQSSPAGVQLVVMKTISDDQTLVWGIRSEEATASGAWITAVASKRARSMS